MDAHKEPDPEEQHALDYLAAKHVCVVQENVVLAQENARLAQENAMLRMQAMAPNTMGDVMSMSAPWGYNNTWNASMGPHANLDPSIAWQTYRPQKQNNRPKNTKSNGGNSTTSSFSTVAGDSATTSLNTVCGEEVDGEDKGAGAPPGLSPTPNQPMTTIMMRNLPTTYTRDMLITLMNDEGYAGLYDFMYLPIDFSTSNANGYAFVNFVTPEDAQRFQEHFKGFSTWAVESDNVCDITWSTVLQGLAAHVDRYRSSPVMHEDMPDECKPVVFSNGVRAPFPPPLKKIRAPRIRHSKAA